MTYYVVRTGWNSANQSSRVSKKNPKNRFESNLDNLVLVVDASSPENAKESFLGTVYNNQFLTVYSNHRAVKGLTNAIREYYS